MGHTSKWQFGMQWRDVFWRWKVTMDNDYVSTKSITIFIIELGIWVIRTSGNLGCNGGTFFGVQWHQSAIANIYVFLVPIISSHDKLWGLARRVFTLLTMQIECLIEPNIGRIDSLIICLTSSSNYWVLSFLTALHPLLLLLKQVVEVSLAFLPLDPKEGELDVRWGGLGSCNRRETGWPWALGGGMVVVVWVALGIAI